MTDQGQQDGERHVEPSGAPRGTTGLSDADRRLLELESRTFRRIGEKERRIREELGLSPLAYLVRLNALLDEPDALRAAPALVNRLRARRTSSEDPTAAPGRVA